MVNDTPINSVWKFGAIDVRLFVAEVRPGFVRWVRPNLGQHKGQHAARTVTLRTWLNWRAKAVRVDA